MKMTPVVSVIMPVYNAEATLLASVESVQAQSFQDWEIILIDDGSTDASARIANQLTAQDHRVSLICQDNQGPSSARNRGLSKALGCFVAFLDADDRWDPVRLAGMLLHFERHPAAGVLFSRTRFLDAVSGAPGTITPHIHQISAKTLLSENPVCSTSNIICRASVIETVGNFRTGLDYAEDQDWLLRVALQGTYEIRGVDAVWLDYRSSPGSQSSDLTAMLRGWRSLLQANRADYPDQIEAIERQATGRFHRHLARRALRLRRPTAALTYLMCGLRSDPALILREPKRTLLTLIGTMLGHLPSRYIQERLAQ